MAEHDRLISGLLSGVEAMVLTGSGTSQFAGECVHPALQSRLKIPCSTVAAGAILTNPGEVLPPQSSALLVSLARSGDSPESFAAIELVLKIRPGIRHLVLTCNPEGRIATSFPASQVAVVLLPERTHDRSFVMTSSFTNLVLAARLLAPGLDIEGLSRTASHVLNTYPEALAVKAGLEINRAVYLGTGCSAAAARECGLKMLEMTSGRIATLSESFLGLRHGPMSFLDSGTLVVCFVSSHPSRRGYEFDLMRELDAKRLGAAKIVVGEDIPPELITDRDLLVDTSGDDSAPVIAVLVGQLLALYRCMHEGLEPDNPSIAGVINRVVQDFQMYSGDPFS